jgi:5-methylcytosine-specific restriction endonuclease McrA
MAFAGDYTGHKGEHSNLFKRVEVDDILFMYHSKSGYVGVGILISKWDREIYEGDQRLLYTEEKYEYRVPVRWIKDFRQSPLTWEDGLPKPIPGMWQKIDIQRFPAALTYAEDSSLKPLARYEEELNKLITESLRDSDSARRERLARAPRIPRLLNVVTTVYARNPDVIAEVLKRASGKCELCGRSAPFNRKSDGSPYLEVHHIQQLAAGGLDTESNAQALCPNCHRRAHFGMEET